MVSNMDLKKYKHDIENILYYLGFRNDKNMSHFLHPKTWSTTKRGIWLGILQVITLYEIMTVINNEHYTLFSLGLAILGFFVFFVFCPVMWYLNKDLKI